MTGRKYDQGKAMMGCIPPNAELEIAEVLTFGVNKYGRGGWSEVPSGDVRYMDAALRHLNAYRRGEHIDEETGKSHLAHAACCLLFLIEMSK